MRVDIPVGLELCSEPVPYAVVEEDCTSGLVIEVFDDSDKVGAGVVLLHGCPQSCMIGTIKLACCMVCNGQLVASSVT